jgi:hypothetical protein
MSRASAVLVTLMLIVIGSSSFVAARWPGAGVIGQELSAPRPCPDGLA